MTFYRTAKLPVVEMLPGIKRTAVWTENVMLTFFRFEPGAIVPEHDHSNEQITIVVEGAMEFMLGGQVQVLRAGDGACIPPGTAHSARILGEPTVAYDAWSPPRDDYKS